MVYCRVKKLVKRLQLVAINIKLNEIFLREIVVSIIKGLETILWWWIYDAHKVTEKRPVVRGLIGFIISCCWQD